MRTVLLVSLLIFFFAGTAFSEEYLVDFKLNGKSLGSFIVYQNGKEYFIEPRVFDTLGLPVSEEKPVSFFEKYGKIKFDRAKQIIWFTPDNPTLFESKTVSSQNVEKVVENQTSIASVKSIDYSFSYNTNSDKSAYSFSGTGTGRIYKFDVDYRFQKNGKGFFNLQWHDERGNYFKDIQIGRLKEYNLDGLSVSNEPYTRYGEFGKDRITVYYPAGTRVDIYRYRDYIATYTVDRQPFEISIDLLYGINEYRIVSYFPSGEIKEDTITKTVDSYLVPKRNISYYAAIGQDPLRKEMKHIARLSYGIDNNLTLTGEWTENLKFGSYFRINPSIFLSGSLLMDLNKNNSGIELSGLCHDGFNLSVYYRELGDNKNLNISTALRFPLSPALTYAETKTNTTDISRGRLQFYIPIRQLFVNPFGEISRTNGETTTKYGFNSMLIMPHKFRVNAEYTHEIMPMEKKKDSLAFSLVKETGIGEFILKQSYQKDPEQSLKLQTSEFRANIYRFRYTAISVAYTYNHTTRDYSVMFGITGSITRKGLNRDYQGQRASIYVRPFIDNNSNGIYDEGDETLTDVDAHISNQKYPSNTVITDLVPYRDYIIRIEDAIGYVPDYHTVKINPNRGSITYIDIPFSELTEIEGYLNRDGIDVALVDKETGKVVRRMKTIMGGYYLFTIPSKLKNKVKVVVL